MESAVHLHEGVDNITSLQQLLLNLLKTRLESRDPKHVLYYNNTTKQGWWGDFNKTPYSEDMKYRVGVAIRDLNRVGSVMLFTGEGIIFNVQLQKLI